MNVKWRCADVVAEAEDATADGTVRLDLPVRADVP